MTTPAFACACQGCFRASCSSRVACGCCWSRKTASRAQPLTVTLAPCHAEVPVGSHHRARLYPPPRPRRLAFRADGLPCIRCCRPKRTAAQRSWVALQPSLASRRCSPSRSQPMVADVRRARRRCHLPSLRSTLRLERDRDAPRRDPDGRARSAAAWLRL